MLRSSRVFDLLPAARILFVGILFVGKLFVGRLGVGMVCAVMLCVVSAELRADDPVRLPFERGFRSPLERTRQRTVRSLIARGGDGLQVARELLDHPDRRVRKGCLEVLERIGEPSDLDRLGALAGDLDHEVRRAAAGASVAIYMRNDRDPSTLLDGGVFQREDLEAWTSIEIKSCINGFFRRLVPVSWSYDRPYGPMTRLGRLAVEPLTKLIRDPFRSAKYRAHALIALSRIGDPKTISLFQEIISSDMPLSLLEAEGELESDYARPTLVGAAAAGLANLGHFDDGVLRHALLATNDFDESVRSYGNWALTTWGFARDSEVRQALVASVKNQILAERCDHVISMIAYVAQRHMLEEVVTDFLLFLGLDPGYVRYEVLETLLQIAPNHPGVAEFTRAAVSVADFPALRVLACDHLGLDVDRELLTDELLLQMEPGTIEGWTDRDQFRKKTGIKALAKVGGERARKVLENYLTDGNDQLRTLAAAHLAVINAPESVESLTGALDDRSEYVRLFAARSLIVLDDRSGLSVLAELLDLGNRFSEDLAVELLRSSTGQSFGYDSTAGPSARREAAGKWRRWVRENE